MKDSAILGTGNSRYLKSVANFKTLYPTYDDFVAALVAGTLPVDLNGINPAGFQQVGDGLGKATLLKDTTAALYGLDASAVPDDVLALLKTLVGNAQASANDKVKIEIGSYTGNGESVTKDNPLSLTFTATPKLLIVYSLEGASQDAVAFFFPLSLTESYKSTGYVGFMGGGANVFDAQYTFAKKSADGLTVTWYSQNITSNYGLNYSNRVYRYLAFI